MASGREQLLCDFDNVAEKRALLTRLGVLRGPWRVELSRYRETRSTAANRYYWGVVVAAFYNFLREQDYAVNHPEDAHELLKAKFLKRDVVDPATGEIIETITRSTARLDVGEFADYLTRCRAWLLDFFGIILPDDPVLSAPPREALRRSA